MPSTLYEQLIAQQRQQQPTDYSSYQNPTAAGFSGLLGGLERGLTEQRNLQLAQVEDSRRQALELFKSVPLNEHNFPIVMRAMTDILQAAPGKKHWADQLGASNPQQDAVLKQIWGVVQKVLPQDANLGKDEYVPYDDKQKAVTQIASAVGTKGAAISPAPDGTVRHTAADPTKLQFLPEGKWQTINDVFEDEAGNKVIKAYDKDTMTVKDINLGKVKTAADRKLESQLEIYNAKRKADLQKPVIQQMMKQTGLEYDGLVNLGPERWADEFQQATQALAQVDREKSDVRTSMTERNRRDPASGLTPAQETQAAERRQREANDLQEKLAKAESDLAGAEAEYNTLLSQIRIARGTNFDPDKEDPGTRFRDKYREARAKLESNRKLVEGYRKQLGTMKVTKPAKTAAAPSRMQQLNRVMPPKFDWDGVMRNNQIQGDGTNAPNYNVDNKR
jgi:hypothetical protein